MRMLRFVYEGLPSPVSNLSVERYKSRTSLRSRSAAVLDLELELDQDINTSRDKPPLRPQTLSIIRSDYSSIDRPAEMLPFTSQAMRSLA